MRDLTHVAMGVVLAGAISGCRTATRITQEPRVDLEVSGGNRGYLISQAPASSANRPTTRQMVETEIEVPSLSKLGRGRASAGSLKDVAPPETDLSEEEAMPPGALPAFSGTYVVKKGDTLWSIAADPQVFGNAGKWRQLFEANRDVLKSPDRLRAGMKLRVPHDHAQPESPAQGQTTFTK